MNKDIILLQPKCGKYDMFIMDMPLGLLYMSRLLVETGYNVHVVDQRVEKENTYAVLGRLLEREPLWVGVTAMTGEPVRHALELCRFVRSKSEAPIVWGGIHPTILPDQTIASPMVDYLIRGKGERSALALSKALVGDLPGGMDEVPGLTFVGEDGHTRHNPEDDESDWAEMPMVPYHLIDVDKYWRVGFTDRIFSIMTSRNCPHKCAFCYNSSLKRAKRWLPDSLEYTKRHLDYILDNHKPEYLSFIDDDFFIDRDRAWEILKYLENRAPGITVGFRGARISDLARLDDDFLDLLDRVNTRHINIGVESGSPRILKIIRKGITVEQTLEVNRRLAKRPHLIPLYNFFSGIPQETEQDVKMSTDLILRLVDENPNCQISGYHQYTPYPGNELYLEAVKQGFPEPQSLEQWGALRFEDNARNCPWIDKRRRRLLDMAYSMIYFVDNKYETYIAGHNRLLRALLPLVKLYRPIARYRMRHHVTALPLEVMAKNIFYRLMDRE